MKEPAVKDNLSKEIKKRGLILGFPQKGIFRGLGNILKCQATCAKKNPRGVHVKRSTKSMIYALIVVAAIVSACVIAFVYHATAPLAQRQVKTTYTPKENVVITAATFNGNIEIRPTTSSQIELIYNIASPDGYLNEIKTNSNETKTEDTTTITTRATLQSVNDGDFTANLIINLPSTSTYNLTVTTSNGNIDIQSSNSKEINAMAFNGNVQVGLPTGTLFQVAASVGNGQISHQGVTLDASMDTATRLKGATLGGEGNLTLTLNCGNGNIAIMYL